MLELTITKCINDNEYAYIAGKDKRYGWIKVEVQPSDYWVGGDEDGWTTNSNEYFETPKSIEAYYKRTCTEFKVFEDEYECDEYLDLIDPQ